MSQPLQLPLSVQLRDDATFANYFSGPNYSLVNMLDLEKCSDEVTPESFFYLYGTSGAGCSHLLQAACHQSDRLGFRSAYLPMDEMVDYSPRILEGYDAMDLICLDNIEAIAGDRQWEEAIFNLFNSLRDSGKRLLVAAHCPPRQLPLELPDLVSRLSWGLVFQVMPLSDQDKLMSLRLRAHLRGLDLTEDVARFILNRSPRTMQDLFKVLSCLDGESLRAKRKLSIPFVKEVMGW